MNINWIDVVVSVLSISASAGVSIYISKKTAKAEIEKLQAIWEHEKETACDADFDQIVADVTAYLKYASVANFQTATNSVAIYRAKATGDIAGKVDKLDKLIVRNAPNFAEIENALCAVIECKREGNH